MPQYQGVWSLQQQMQALTSGQWATDPLFDYTTLLLQADNAANSAQNNTFLDSSTNAFAITRNGNTTQGSFSPFSLQPGAWGNYFDGSYLTVPANNAFVFGTGDFTIELWVYQTAAWGINNLLNNVSAGNQSWSIGVEGGNIVFGGWNVSFLNGGTQPSINAWHHVAVVRSGTTLSMFVDGVRTGTTTNSTDFASNNTLVIGGFQYSSTFYYITGYLSNVRLVKGTAVYNPSSTTCTVPTAPLTAISGTSILTCQNNRFIDNSSNAFAVSVSAGTPSVQAFSPFAPQYQWTSSVIGGSGYFDGSGDYLTTNNINLASNAFTIEGWFYITTTAGNMNYWGMNNGGGANPKCILYMDNGGNIAFETGSVSGTVISASISTYIRRNAWQHIAISRSGTGASQTAMFIDGVRAGTGTCASLATVTGGFNIGYIGEAFGVTLNGYVSGFRIVNGTAVYNPASTTVTIPTAPPTAVTNTSLLTNFTNAGIYDGTMKNNLETVGNASVSTSVVKYGSGSLAFDGTGDYLLIPSSSVNRPLFDFGSGDWTVEFWINWTTAPSATTEFRLWWSSVRSVGVARLDLYVYNNIVYAGWSGTNVLDSGALSWTSGQWYHMAFVRSGNSWAAYRDGTRIASATNSTTLVSSPAKIIGENVNGYIDDFRVTTGYARYMQNFIPPSVALPRQ